jgi:cysteine desulfuration protein SufE
MMAKMIVGLPKKFQEALELFASISERNERSELLIYYADQFQEVPPEIATRPFPESHRVPFCESQAYVWAAPLDNGSLKFYFAVENPQGLSARALSVLLGNYCSGVPIEQLTDLSPDIVYTIFGRDLGLVRAEGLRGIVKMVHFFTMQARKPIIT